MRELIDNLIEKEQSERQVKIKKSLFTCVGLLDAQSVRFVKHFDMEVGSFVRGMVFKRTFKGLFFEKYEG